MNLQHFYKDRIKQFEYSKKQLNKKIIIVSVIRLLIFISIPLFLVVFRKYGLSVKSVIVIFQLTAFILSVKWYLSIKRKIIYISNLIIVNQNELKALGFKFDQFNNGEKYIEPDHPYLLDLDIFGEGSIFQMINRTVTHFGVEHLAVSLKEPLYNWFDIKKHQEAVSEISNNIELLHDYQAKGMDITETQDDINYLNRWLNSENYFSKKIFFKLMRWLLPGITLIIMFSCIVVPALIPILIFLTLIQLLVVSFFLKRINDEHGLLHKRVNIIKKYACLLKIIEEGQFQSDYLNELKKDLNLDDIPVHTSLYNLSRIVAGFDNRMNLLAAVFLEGILLWDIQCMIRLELWKKKYKREIHKWFSVIGKFETIISLASFKINNPGYVFPELSEKIPLSAAGLGHPFIIPKDRVLNDFEISKQGKFCIITGANMSGKSTFLRTVGLNLVMAMIGAPVCAGSFKFIPQKLFSSMRTTDSLQKNESYFYAELLRLKHMLEGLEKNEVTFILLDEILKGTNSKDKQAGSRKVLHQIIELGGTGIIATHDLELTDTESIYPDKVENKCFEIYIEDSVIDFDYKLKDGVTTKMNALLLMKQMGIIEK